MADSRPETEIEENRVNEQAASGSNQTPDERGHTSPGNMPGNEAGSPANQQAPPESEGGPPGGVHGPPGYDQAMTSQSQAYESCPPTYDQALASNNQAWDGNGQPPAGYTQPPTGYVQPPTEYTQPPTGYVPPPTGYAQPPAGFVPPPAGFAPPPGGYPPPPDGYAPPPGGCEPSHAGYAPPDYKPGGEHDKNDLARSGFHGAQYGPQMPYYDDATGYNAAIAAGAANHPAQPTQPVVMVIERGMAVANPPPDHMACSIFVCLCCCCPLGLYAILLSNNSRKAAAEGDIVRARSYGAQAKKVIIIGFVVGLLCCAVSTAFKVVNVLNENNQL